MRTCEPPSRGSKLRGKIAQLVRVGYLPVAVVSVTEAVVEVGVVVVVV